MKSYWLYTICALLIFPVLGYGQDCNILSKANDINPDQLCSPVQVVTWDVSYVDVNHAGTLVEIHFDWDDGASETIVATEIDAAASEWLAIATHTYVSDDDICNHRPIATLMVNGVMCSSSAQEQIITVWDNDNSNGGRVNASPDVYPICVGNGATMQFDDNTLFNCVPPQEEDVPNDRTRWIQWVYGTNITMTGAPVMVDGVVQTYPFSGPVIELTGPVTGSNERSLPITVANDKLVGQEFEVELRYWNYCNPYPTSDPVTDRSVIRIVDIPDATITPVDTLCELESNIYLTAATEGGTWSGTGIINASTGEFSPSVAGSGTHTITYHVTAGFDCSSTDTEDIVVRPGPDGTITPVDPFCTYDSPYDLEAASALGTWAGSGIINSSTGLFDPTVAGPGSHIIAFESVPDAYGCVGIDTVELDVMEPPNAEFLTPDGAWCQNADNQSIAEILINGAENSFFELILELQGIRDTLLNLSNDTVSILLNNEAGLNQYNLVKIIEYHDNNTCETELFDTLKMEVHPMPVIEFTASYDDLCSPVEVDFESVEGYETYTWDFGDGKLQMTANNHVSHTYHFDYDEMFQRTDTVFYIQLIVETAFGCTDSLNDSIQIYPTPEADFFVNPLVQDFPDSEIELINLSSPGNWSYFWDFGDGNSDSQKDPEQHTYGDWGFYDVKLLTFSPYCRDSISKQIQIRLPPPQAIFQPDTSGCSPLDVSFRNQSLHADAYLWDFDDGTYSTEASPTHRFWESKAHQVKLIAYGLSGTDTAIQIILVHPMPAIEFTASYDDLCSPVEVDFESLEGYETYTWDFGDGKLQMTSNNHVSHTYHFDSDEMFQRTDTVFYIQLIVETAFGCTDSLNDSIHIYLTPEADFFVNPLVQDFPDSEIELINLSSPGNWSYLWDFGDGNSDSQKDPEQHTYGDWGFYDVKLLTFSPYCRDSISKQIQIRPPPPQAIFQPDTSGCPPLDVTFRNQSLYADSYIWDFDDGTYSTEASPTHRFWESKAHQVELIAYGLSGTNTAKQIILVHPGPKALFEAYPREAKNLKQVIKFLNNSIDGDTYLWDFGDGNTSNDENPAHVYKEPGIFTVSLYVWSDHSCPDTLILEKLINVMEGEGNTVFPNVFKWNGTGPSGGNWGENAIDNTIFHPHLKNVVDLHMLIYTRWGEMIWETTNKYIGWDGYLKSGELVEQGIYIYKAWVTYRDGSQEVLAGDVTFLY